MKKDILDTIKTTDERIDNILSSKEFEQFMDNSIKQAIKDNTHVTFDLYYSQCSDIRKKLLKLVDFINYESYESNLLDNYLFYTNGRTIKEFEDYPKTNYIILTETYVNCWTSTYTVTLTNNEKLASDFQGRAIEYWDKVEKEEECYLI